MKKTSCLVFSGTVSTNNIVRTSIAYVIFEGAEPWRDCNQWQSGDRNTFERQENGKRAHI